ncbi:hypothetical protein CDL62_03575 [Alkalitalea saponilacus]|nr:hypothetical protein CDL62_03575 [Alkalitalea saponilacus]
MSVVAWLYYSAIVKKKQLFGFRLQFGINLAFAFSAWLRQIFLNDSLISQTISRKIEVEATTIYY